MPPVGSCRRSLRPCRRGPGHGPSGVLGRRREDPSSPSAGPRTAGPSGGAGPSRTPQRQSRRCPGRCPDSGSHRRSVRTRRGPRPRPDVDRGGPFLVVTSGPSWGFVSPVGRRGSPRLPVKSSTPVWVEDRRVDWCPRERCRSEAVVSSPGREVRTRTCVFIHGTTPGSGASNPEQDPRRCPGSVFGPATVPTSASGGETVLEGRGTGEERVSSTVGEGSGGDRSTGTGSDPCLQTGVDVGSERRKSHSVGVVAPSLRPGPPGTHVPDSRPCLLGLVPPPCVRPGRDFCVGSGQDRGRPRAPWRVTCATRTDCRRHLASVCPHEYPGPRHGPRPPGRLRPPNPRPHTVPCPGPRP